MALTSREHQDLSRQTRAARNTGAAVRRASNRQRVSGAVVLHATDSAGAAYVLVLCSAKEPGRAYVLTRDRKTQEWCCGCFSARWQSTCDHLEAMSAHEANGAAT